MLSSVICSKTDKMQCLVDQLKRLNLQANYRHFDYSQHGFYTCKAHEVEQMIHSQLHKSYGFGKVYCEGCGGESPNVHQEWFLVPRRDIKRVFRVIDRTCQ